MSIGRGKCDSQVQISISSTRRQSWCWCSSREYVPRCVQRGNADRMQRYTSKQLLLPKSKLLVAVSTHIRYVKYN